MMHGITFAKVVPPAEHPSMLVILVNTMSEFHLEPELDDAVSNLLVLPYEIPEDDTAFMEIADLYVAKLTEAYNSGRMIILMHNTPFSCVLLQTLREKTTQPNAAGWIIVSFFHEDEDLLNAKINMPAEARLDWKMRDLEALLPYPFVDKINVPYRHEITAEYLFNLIIEKRLSGAKTVPITF
jgi:hypothetical protein